MCHLPLVFLSPTSPLPFYLPSLSILLLFPICLFLPACFLFACALVRLLVIMASPLSSPLTPEFKIFHFKQRLGENLKDAWLIIMESYRNCTFEVNLRIFLCNFYVGLNMSHRQLLDCVAKGNFIEIDPHIALEIIEGIVGTLP